MKYYIRLAEEKDLDSIFEIEKNSFEDNWSYELLKYDLTKYELSKYFIIEDAENFEILAFLGMMQIMDEVHITNIAVKKTHRRLGLAKALLYHLDMIYKDENIYGITLEVAENNFPAINLYKKSGFIEEGKRLNYYKNNINAIVMWKYFKEKQC